MRFIIYYILLFSSKTRLEHAVPPMPGDEACTIFDPLLPPTVSLRECRSSATKTTSHLTSVKD